MALPSPWFRCVSGRRLRILAALFLSGCAACGYEPEAEGDALERRQGPVRISGMWSPPAHVLAIGDRVQLQSQGSVRIAEGGSCSSTNPWTCSCQHPACSAGLPGTLEFGRYLRQRFPQITSAGGYSCCRQNTGNTAYLSVHSLGRAIDLMIPTISGDADNTKGDEVANWLIENAQRIGIQYIAWDRADWSVNRPAGSRMRAYTGPIPHVDHIHMELNLDGANKRTPFFGQNAGESAGACQARCEGSVMIQSDCSRGDCGYFGVDCVADPTPRCVVPGCPTRGTGVICLNDSEILGCRDGVPTGPPGNCADFGSFCSTAGVASTEARCLLSLCVASAQEVPRDHDTCSIFPGNVLRCFASGEAEEVACPEGKVCSLLGGQPTCIDAHPDCPVSAFGPLQDSTVCASDAGIARCINGNLFPLGRCSGTTVCTAAGGTAVCAQSACVGADGELMRRPVCTPQGDRARCDAVGQFAAVEPCPEGERCELVAEGSHCVPGERPATGGGTSTPETPETPGNNGGEETPGAVDGPESGDYEHGYDIPESSHSPITNDAPTPESPDRSGGDATTTGGNRPGSVAPQPASGCRAAQGPAASTPALWVLLGAMFAWRRRTQRRC